MFKVLEKFEECVEKDNREEALALLDEIEKNLIEYGQKHNLPDNWMPPIGHELYEPIRLLQDILQRLNPH